MVIPLITEQDLIEAIAECQGQRNPNSSTCIKLAAFYTILDHVREGEQKEPVQPGYSFSASPAPDTVTYQGDSDFSNLVYGMDSNTAWSIVDELMDTLSITNPRLYKGVLRKIEGGL